MPAKIERKMKQNYEFFAGEKTFEAQNSEKVKNDEKLCLQAVRSIDVLFSRECFICCQAPARSRGKIMKEKIKTVRFAQRDSLLLRKLDFCRNTGATLQKDVC